jgi:hypothetical protein
MNDAMQRGDVMRWNLAFSAGACAASWALVSPRFAASLALGAVLEMLNFRALWGHAERVLLGRGAAGAAMGAFGLRFVLLGAVLFVALDAGAHPVGLVVGLSLMVPAVLLAAWQRRPGAGPLAPAPPPDDPSWDDWNPWLARERRRDDEEDEA